MISRGFIRSCPDWNRRTSADDVGVTAVGSVSGSYSQNKCQKNEAENMKLKKNDIYMTHTIII